MDSRPSPRSSSRSSRRAALATPVALYPLEGVGFGRDVLTRLQELVIEGVWHVARRTERLEPREPVVVDRRCGSASARDLACLARLAQGGVLVLGEVSREGGDAIVTLQLVDRRGRVSAPSWFRMNPGVLRPEPAAFAVGQLEHALASGSLQEASRPAPAAAAATHPGADEVLPGWREKPAPPPR